MDIKQERENYNLSTEQMAELLGVSKRTVEAWESGARNPSKQVKMLIEKGILNQGPQPKERPNIIE